LRRQSGITRQAARRLRGFDLPRSEDDLKEISLAESRIAGAINILLLKLFGYSGYIRHSAFEDGYRQI